MGAVLQLPQASRRAQRQNALRRPQRKAIIAKSDFPRASVANQTVASQALLYLLAGLRIDRPNQVWCDDITCIPMRRGFLYLVAIMDWFARKVLAWHISNTLEADFCLEALNEAMHKFGPPEIMHTDQCSPVRMLRLH